MDLVRFVENKNNLRCILRKSHSFYVLVGSTEWGAIQILKIGFNFNSVPFLSHAVLIRSQNQPTILENKI